MSENKDAEMKKQEREQIVELGSDITKSSKGSIYTLTIIGQVEGHNVLPEDTKTTKYEHVLPALVAIEQDRSIEGLLILLNTMGGDVEAGLAIAEVIAGMQTPTVSLVVGGGHSIGIPLAVSADISLIVPSASMTVHPVRTSGLVLGVPQTLRYFEQMQQRITGFVAGHSHISEARFTELMMHTGELVMDMGSVVDGETAVAEGLIDELGGLGDALHYLYRAIEAPRDGAPEQRKAGGKPRRAPRAHSAGK